MKEYLEKTKIALNQLKNHLTPHGEDQTASVTDLDKQESDNPAYAFIVDWQEPMLIKDMGKNM
ncbi:hypothetical protein E9993_16780 [Labilibacter sediminis]|nr:hypothetical protein E9993_16780 [Labilibacter sediminis]